MTQSIQIKAARSQAAQGWHVFKKDKLAIAGATIIILVTLISIFAPIIAPYDPNVTQGPRLQPIGTSGHPLGLDGQGRDILSRLIWGGRLSLVSAIIPLLFMFFISLFIGLLAGFFPKLGEVVMRVLDILFAFPMVLIAVGIASIVGAGLFAIMLSISLVLLPYMSRVVYTATVEERDKEYVEAARALGSSQSDIMFRELLPNVISALIVYATTLAGVMIVFSAGLSFLGLGIQPPDADWGRMTATGLTVMTQGAPHVATLPGVIILIVATAFNWLGDGLQDVFNPYKRTE
ncbi:dipeptide transport system permease protein DppC [Geomicrobium sp. JCM 19037]|uniref:ABC transporter permease n=1 Tax=Geomicrobium sp. JCM 19037 TaxID=1460634 RepID=UPI00045F163B|nr:ABC transporter permease [Geomicrobium sp. JCM 19037]GAK04388.1 dipeptide transport system permease protein DppC [Geomicrobium sp. JCM 19037]